MNDDGNVSLRLTQAEALVLFEWLYRSDKGSGYALREPAENCVLERVAVQLEKALPESTLADYQERVAAARRADRGARTVGRSGRLGRASVYGARCAQVSASWSRPAFAPASRQRWLAERMDRAGAPR